MNGCAPRLVLNREGSGRGQGGEWGKPRVRHLKDIFDLQKKPMPFSEDNLGTFLHLFIDLFI